MPPLFFNRLRATRLALLALAWVGSGSPHGVAAATPTPTPLPAADQPVRIRFAARVNGAPFACDKTYAEVGRSKSTYAPQDFRLYVSAMVLLRANGTAVAVQLDDDGLWQQHDVALLDFENARGSCQNGTPAQHTEVTGHVAAYDDYTGIRFDLGVPFALDHQDASVAAPPFDQAGMFWGWQAGYKFLSIDARIDDRVGHSLHIASTGCQMDVPGHVTSCRAPNVAQVTLQRFNVAKNVIVADIGRLLQDATLVPTPRPKPTPGRPASHLALPNGCMSEAYNANCQPIFAKLGLPFAGQPPGAAGQQFFSVD